MSCRETHSLGLPTITRAVFSPGGATVRTRGGPSSWTSTSSLAVFALPPTLPPSLRTTNLIERAFRDAAPGACDRSACRRSSLRQSHPRRSRGGPTQTSSGPNVRLPYSHMGLDAGGRPGLGPLPDAARPSWGCQNCQNAQPRRQVAGKRRGIKSQTTAQRHTDRGLLAGEGSGKAGDPSLGKQTLCQLSYSRSGAAGF
jgi:hypothetical protein